MSALSIDDEDDVEFQADLARAIAASLEPDVPGPQDDAPLGDTSGWSALLAAGQAATWMRSGLNAGRCSPALITAEDDDDDFQRQIAVAMAASIQSAEEDRRRRECGTNAILGSGNHSAQGVLPMQGPQNVPPHGAAPESIWRPPAALLQQQQPQGFVTNEGSICCSSGLLLKPLAAASEPSKRTSLQAPVSGSSCRTSGGTQRPDGSFPSSDADAMQWSTGAASQGMVAPSREYTEEAAPPERVGKGPMSALGASPGASPCLLAWGSVAPGRVPFGAVAAPRNITPPLQPETEIASGGAGRGGLQGSLSSSPGKHARTPSARGLIDSAQPQMKRSRPGSDSGSAGMTMPCQPRVCDALRNEAGWQPPWQPEMATNMAAGWSDGGEDTCMVFSDKAVVATTQSYSPPERPASAASCCAPSAGCRANALEDGDCAAAMVSVADMELSVAPQDEAWNQGGALHPDGAPGPSPSPQQQPSQPQHCVQTHVLDGAESAGGRGQGPLSRSGLVPHSLNLSAGAPAVAVVSHGEGQGQPDSGVSDVNVRQLQQQHPHTRARADLAPLDLSQPGLGLAQAAQKLSSQVDRCSPSSSLPRWSLGLPPAVAQPSGFVSEPHSTSRGHHNSDPMITDSPPPQLDDADAIPTHATLTAVPAMQFAGAAAPALVPSWRYSSADRRMLLQQRVWWWLGPGQVQSGRISSIDRRSEPLLYSVRLDPLGDGIEGQTIIATADCLFPYMSHGDKVMCRLPPSVGEAVRMSGSSSTTGPGGAQTDSGAIRHSQQLEEWPSHSTTESGSEDLAESQMTSGPCAWMCGTLQHCMFDGCAPMVHVLLGPAEVPYSMPYKFVVPVCDAAEGSGCSPPPQASALVTAVVEPVAFGPVRLNSCTDIVPVGPAA